MILPKEAILVAAALAFNLLQNTVDAHGYMKSPRSRNYYANTNGVWWGGGESDPRPENCPHCLNIGGTEARCGLIEDRNYDYPKNFLGGIMPTVIQGCYKPGSIVDFETILTAHHMGHFEFFACPVAHGEVPTQACFDAHPLTFVSDEFYGATPDPNFPERAYIPRTDFPGGLVKEGSSYSFRHKYRLPANLSGDLVLIQWHYVTGNSCKDAGYDTYNWPAGFYPGDIPVCSQPLPPDGRGVPEQFWNCAEVKISNSCDGPAPSTTSTSSTTTGTGATTSSTTTSTITTTATRPANCATETAACGLNNPCGGGMCCSQWGYCGLTDAYCGACCQTGCWNNPNPPSPTPPSPTTGKPTNPPLASYTANHGEDSRLIAYVGNWQTCPTDAQVDAYSHMVIAFGVSYTWDAAKNNCDTQCRIGTSVPICNNSNNQALVDKWRSMGKKVILSFGGAGMGGSWSGDNNNCWDYCFGKEEELSSSLVTIIKNQNLDGIDIDYEYCFDVNGLQSGGCTQRSNLYSDEKAQTFLNTLTSKLRVKLDALQASNGYSRGRYEVTHAPMDVDVSRPDSKYYQILKARRDDLDFIMPQMYNGVTRPGIDGVDGIGAGSMSAAALFRNIANDLFDGQPNKVVFGFCISDCSGTGSNVNGNQAVTILADLKSYNNKELSCNGGAFFWVAQHDIGGAWSDVVLSEVSRTAGCSNPSTTTSKPTNSPVTSKPTKQPTTLPTTAKPTNAPVTPKPTNRPTNLPTTAKPTNGTVTPKPTNQPTKWCLECPWKLSNCGVKLSVVLVSLTPFGSLPSPDQDMFWYVTIDSLFSASSAYVHMEFKRATVSEE
ncbi:hypothetical protein ACHAW6_012519 [Cyclotella cf. meneghiniana]